MTGTGLASAYTQGLRRRSGARGVLSLATSLHRVLALQRSQVLSRTQKLVITVRCKQKHRNQPVTHPKSEARGVCSSLASFSAATMVGLEDDNLRQKVSVKGEE